MLEPKASVLDLNAHGSGVASLHALCLENFQAAASLDAITLSFRKGRSKRIQREEWLRVLRQIYAVLILSYVQVTVPEAD